MQQVEGVYVVRGGDKGFTQIVQMCDEPCKRCFAKNRGYFNIRNGVLDEKTVRLITCKKQEDHGAQAIVGLVNNEPVWQCLDCPK